MGHSRPMPCPRLGTSSQLRELARALRWGGGTTPPPPQAEVNTRAPSLGTGAAPQYCMPASPTPRLTSFCTSLLMAEIFIFMSSSSWSGMVCTCGQGSDSSGAGNTRSASGTYHLQSYCWCFLQRHARVEPVTPACLAVHRAARPGAPHHPARPCPLQVYPLPRHRLPLAQPRGPCSGQQGMWP